MPSFQLVHCSGEEATILERNISKIGNDCWVSNDTRYDPRCDILVRGKVKLGNGEPTPLYPQVLCYLVSGKPVVTSEFVLDSAAQKKLLDPELYICNYTKDCREFVKSLNRPLFSGWHATVILRDPAKRIAFERVLEAGGATVQRYYNARYLVSAEPLQLMRLTHVFTDPGMLANPEFEGFMSNRRAGNWKVGVYSFYYLVKYIINPRDTSHQNLSYFEITNPRLLSILHNPNLGHRIKRRVGRKSIKN